MFQILEVEHSEFCASLRNGHGLSTTAPGTETELLMREPLQLERLVGAPLQPRIFVQAAPAFLSAAEERFKSV